MKVTINFMKCVYDRILLGKLSVQIEMSLSVQTGPCKIVIVVVLRVFFFF